MNAQITSATAVGLRPYQEDRHVIHSTDHGTLLAILDGHGGDEAAAIGQNSIPHLWDGAFSGDPAAALASVVKSLADLTQDYRSGAALSLVFIPADSKAAHIAILGDAPVVAALPDGSTHVSPEHNVRTNDAERKAAQGRGGIYQNGYICKGYNGLQMSRALGDASLQPVVSQEPEIYSVDIDGFVVVASDGVFDPGHYNSSSEIKEVVSLVRSGANAQDLVDRAVKKKTGDNATAIVFRKREQNA